MTSTLLYIYRTVCAGDPDDHVDPVLCPGQPGELPPDCRVDHQRIRYHHQPPHGTRHHCGLLSSQAGCQYS
jgi:hypothetical protein